MRSLLFYDSEDGSSDELVKFEPDVDGVEEEKSVRDGGELRLPPPKRKGEIVIPPPPIEMIPVEVVKVAEKAVKESPQEIEVDVEELRREGAELAEKNVIVRDRAQYNRVGYDRSKSQLTYLAKLDEETRGEFEEQMKRVTRAKVATRKMYGW